MVKQVNTLYVCTTEGKQNVHHSSLSNLLQKVSLAGKTSSKSRQLLTPQRILPNVTACLSCSFLQTRLSDALRSPQSASVERTAQNIVVVFFIQTTRRGRQDNFEGIEKYYFAIDLSYLTWQVSQINLLIGQQFSFLFSFFFFFCTASQSILRKSMAMSCWAHIFSNIGLFMLLLLLKKTQMALLSPVNTTIMQFLHIVYFSQISNLTNATKDWRLS